MLYEFHNNLCCAIHVTDSHSAGCVTVLLRSAVCIRLLLCCAICVAKSYRASCVTVVLCHSCKDRTVPLVRHNCFAIFITLLLCCTIRVTIVLCQLCNICAVPLCVGELFSCAIYITVVLCQFL